MTGQKVNGLKVNFKSILFGLFLEKAVDEAKWMKKQKNSSRVTLKCNLSIE